MSSPPTAASATQPAPVPPPSLFPTELNPCILTDSYKATHFIQYAPAQLMTAYGEFRSPFQHDERDHRFVFYGLRYIITHYVQRRWTEQDVSAAAVFYATHNLQHTAFPFPRDLFLRFIREHNGYFPVRIDALPEGTVAHVHTPVFQLFARHEYSQLVTFLETLLTMVWYGSSVATLSRRTKDVIAAAFEQSVDAEHGYLLHSRLHDFGFRGCTTVEQSVVGGCAHLLNFTGSDTLSAAYYAQMTLNGGRPVAQSIPASEHSVMTSWPSERDAVCHLIRAFGGPDRAFSVVMDSYDYTHALDSILPSVAALHAETGGLMVLRPDSGDPCECVLQALAAAERVYGVDVNKKGYKTLRRLAVLQGDGISYDVVQKISAAVLAAGFSAECVAYGMGGGLLQKLNRDSMAFACKLSCRIDADGIAHDVMKRPKHDQAKLSLPGILRVIRSHDNPHALSVVPAVWDEQAGECRGEGESVMRTVWNCGPVDGCWDDFDTVKARVEREWTAAPLRWDVVSPALKARVKLWLDDYAARETQQSDDAVSKQMQPDGQPR